nr:GNAT family N-acetyltransferase [Prevotella sp.]
PACQNQGIGKQLMTELETFFPVSNSFELFTSPITPNTVHLYSSLGYKVIDKRLEDGIEIINMRKDRIG